MATFEEWYAQADTFNGAYDAAEAAWNAGAASRDAEILDLRSKIEAARAEIYDLRARGANSDPSINALYRGWADRMEAALGKQGEGR